MPKRFLGQLALLTLFVVLPLSRATDAKEPSETDILKPFSVDASADTYTLPKLDQELEHWRNAFGLKALEKPEPECTLSFRIFMVPQLIGRPYCAGGKLYLSNSGGGKCFISLHYFEQGKVKEQSWDLTNTQAAQVYLWFRGAKLLNKDTPEGSIAGIDGVAIFIEGYFEDRALKFARNSGNSSASWFFDQVEAFRVWKGLPSVESKLPAQEIKADPR